MIVSQNGGESFACCEVYDRQGQRKLEGKVKVFSDRVDSSLFYGFGEASDFYVSRDGGRTYREYELPAGFPEINFGLIDCANKTEVRGETGKSGVFYMAVGETGIWKLEYHAAEDRSAEGGRPGSAEAGNGIRLTRLTAPGITAYRMGLGLGAPGGDYYRDAKAIYFNGIIDGEYGFYRTLDEGAGYERLNTDRQMFGEINSIDGDCRHFGRFYLATGSNGLKYGEMRNS